MPSDMPSDMPLTWKEAINKVLSSSSVPLDYNEITKRIISEGFREESWQYTSLNRQLDYIGHL